MFTPLRMAPKMGARTACRDSTARRAEAVLVFWRLKTKITPSELTEITAASLTAMAGGQSMRMKLNDSRRLVRICFILFEPKRPQGFGGQTPRDMSDKPLTEVC